MGKSTLFNRLTGSRKAIVGDEPGITRDRIFGEVNWKSRKFRIIDTGGIIPDEEALIPSNIFKQAASAIEEASLIIWVVDARSGITPLDEEISGLLRETGKTILIAANKSESVAAANEAAEFYQFGWDVTPISAEHGTNVGDLLDKVFDVLSLENYANAGFDTPEAESASSCGLKLAIVGRPNVGKSSLVNKLIGEERVIVSPIAGTTRDSVDTELVFNDKKITLIDTAGIRRKGKTRAMAEKLSVVMARKSLERADVAVLVIDAIEGVTALDANIAGYVVEAGCSLIFAINKWDAIEGKSTNTINEFEEELRRQIKFADWAPMLTISALKGQRVTRLLDLAIKANEARRLRIQTSELNRFFERKIAEPLGLSDNNRPRKGRVRYLSQAGVAPPTFVLFSSSRQPSLHFSFLRHIENKLREEYGFFAAPIRLKEKTKQAQKTGA